MSKFDAWYWLAASNLSLLAGWIAYKLSKRRRP